MITNSLLLRTGVTCEEPVLGAGVLRIGDDCRYPKQMVFTCESGFTKVSGSSFRQCQANGTWSGEPLVCGSEYDILTSL
jgi:hypothetical protein